MTQRIAINGFGRIGRLVVRALLDRPGDDVQIVAINDRGGIASNAHLLQFDSVHGRLNTPVIQGDNTLTVGKHTIAMFAENTPETLPWGDLGVDVVMECTGKFANRAGAMMHLAAGAGRVLISAPADDADITVVYGVNHGNVTGEHRIVSNASCTTNCLAPVAAVLDRLCGIRSGIMTTIHAYTNDQRILDGNHRDFRRARTAGASMIPTSTGAAKAVALVLPQLKGKLDGFALRVPVPNVSVVDLTFLPERTVSIPDIHEAMHRAAEGTMKGVLSVNTLPLVSVDFNHASESSIFDATQTRQVGEMIKVLSWYDNEWGFSHRMLDVAMAMKA
jgi:glyceraldehyde 3-phosphate dehydrogenase